ncbi:MAG: NADH-ubiquinone oxidoreductase-F iron-sulfur binding region domain-containing protein, partial [Syntrophomonadaceae bacterium]|nr:NADH-ubiquinone oxidoreductase-F iron-sulfur binding region domain-containing protein [Syntrophomonadaceae bacterium]
MYSLAEVRDECQQLLQEQRGKVRIVIGLGTCGIAAGGEKIWTTVEEELDNLGLDVEMVATGCIGMCYAEPIMEVQIPGKPRILYGYLNTEKAIKIVREHVARGDVCVGDALAQDPAGYEPEPGIVKLNKLPFYRKQVKTVLGRCGIIDPDRWQDYIAYDGYKALEKVVLSMSSQEVIDIIKASGLRGRGGGGFSTGLKWQFVHDAAGDKKYVICNADEGDPGAFMDRSVLEGDPHSILEGMLICAYAIGADEGYIYVRAEYPLAIKRLRKAINDAESLGVLGQNILGTDFNFSVHIAAGAGAFVCGEETALIHSVEGQRGMPSTKPPYPAESGLWNMPTNINNVETYANITGIINNGPEWFASMGTENSKGSKVFALTGKVNRTGLVEVPVGIPLREIVFDIAGGVQNEKNFKAVQIGGPSGGCIPAHLLDTSVDYDSLLELGAMMGSGGLVVMDESTCMVDLARFFLKFTQAESCGKCTPCREGTKKMLDILTKICSGNGVDGDIEKLERLARV